MFFGIIPRKWPSGGFNDHKNADIVIFDPDTIIDRSTFEEPSLPPAGSPWVIVNGRVAVEHATVAGATSGRVLRRDDTLSSHILQS